MGSEILGGIELLSQICDNSLFSVTKRDDDLTIQKIRKNRRAPSADFVENRALDEIPGMATGALIEIISVMLRHIDGRQR